MASITFISNYLSSSSSSSTSCSSTHHLTQTYKPFSSPSTLPFIHGNKKSSRGLSVVTKGGGPSSTSYIFAFIFPISLVAVTIFTAMRITDELDQKFLEEVKLHCLTHSSIDGAFLLNSADVFVWLYSIFELILKLKLWVYLHLCFLIWIFIFAFCWFGCVWWVVTFLSLFYLIR